MRKSEASVILSLEREIGFELTSIMHSNEIPLVQVSNFQCPTSSFSVQIWYHMIVLVVDS
jgi:hypothetical protein